MESAICLHYYPFPFGSKGFHGARPSRFHFKINHATPLSLPQISTTRTPSTRSFGHANCTLERFSVPSENEGSGNKILRGVTSVSLVLACVLGLFNLNPKFASAYTFGPFATANTTAPSKNFDVSRIEDSSKGRVVLNLLLEKWSNSRAEEYNKIRNKKKDQALEEYKKMKKENKSWLEKQRKLAEEFVEGFMFQGNFEAALHVLNDQISLDQISPEPDTLLDSYVKVEFGNNYDKERLARLILYKAIVHTMLKEKEAEKWWEVFIKTWEKSEAP